MLKLKVKLNFLRIYVILNFTIYIIGFKSYFKFIDVIKKQIFSTIIFINNLPL